MSLGAAARLTGPTPLLIAVYATLAITLSGQWIAAKLGVTAVPPLEISTMRFAIASAVLLAACAATGTSLPLHRWRPIAAAAILGVVGFNSLAFVGLSLTPASDSALIIPTMIPMATAVFATLIHEPLTRRKLVGFAIAGTGAALVIAGAQRAGSEPSTDRLLGDLMELGAAIAWAASLVVGATVVRRESVLGYVTLMVLIGTALLLPIGAWQQAYSDVPFWTGATWLAAGFLGVFSTAVAYVLFLWAVRRFGASLAALVSYLTPLGTLVLAFVILGERPLLLQILGGAVIVLGVRLAAHRGSARRNS